MKQKLLKLAALQAIDTESEEIDAKLGEIPNRLAEADLPLTEAERNHSTEKERLEEFKKQYRSLEMEARSALDAARKKQARLMEVKSNKEYQAMLAEIEENKEKNSRIEDEMLLLLESMEQMEEELAGLSARLGEIVSTVRRTKEQIASEQAQLQERQETLKTDWESAAAQVPPDLLKLFLGNRNRGIRPAIASVAKAICSGCNMNIPAQMYNELQLFDSLKFCPFCNRILYWRNAQDG